MRSVLRMLINKCVAVSALPTTVQSPSYKVMVASVELSDRAQETAASTKLVMHIVEAIIKQAHSTTSRRAIRVRHVLARGWVGLTLGNHG